MHNIVGISPLLIPPPVISASQTQARLKHSRPNIVAMGRLPYNIKKGQLQTSAFQSISPRLKCDSAMNVACAAAAATQTVTRDARTITVTPDKKIRLDDNGPGLPPRDDDGNGGNGGGGGGNFSGGLVLLGILGVLDILKDIESEIQRKVKDSRFDQT